MLNGDGWCYPIVSSTVLVDENLDPLSSRSSEGSAMGEYDTREGIGYDELCLRWRTVRGVDVAYIENSLNKGKKM